MANCWRCGGQISSYASRCTWCGRSTSVSAFLQVVAFATLIVAALVVGGLVPIGAFTRFLPTNWLRESPLPARSAEAVEGAGGGQGGRPGAGYGAVGAQPPVPDSRREAAARSEERERVAREEQAAASRPDCDSEVRVNLLSVRYAEWTREDLALIACRRLREGFSEEQLIAARGRPLRRSTPPGASDMEVWIYRDMRVVLERGQVVSVREP